MADTFTATVNALTRALSGQRRASGDDDVAVHPIPPDRWPVLYKLTVRGSAKVELDGVLSSITGHRQEGSVATWVLTQEEVQSLINALQIIRGVQQVGVSSS